MAYPDESPLLNTIAALREGNKINRVVNIHFQSKIPDGYTVEEFAAAVEKVLAAPLVIEPETTDGFIEESRVTQVFNWVELLEVTRSRSTR
jgi:hypothetical protein